MFVDPPYPVKLLSILYPKNYETPTFVLYDGIRGNTIEHVSKFLDSMGPNLGNKELCPREFSKSLIDRALLFNLTPLPHRKIWWKVFVQNIYMGRRLPSSPSIIQKKKKSLPKDSFILSDNSMILLLIVMDSTKNGSL